MGKKTVFVYSDRFGAYYYGQGHPMRPVRLKLTYELMQALGMAHPPGSEVVEARQATEEELLLFHTPEYLKILKEANTGMIPVGGAAHGLGFGDNPVFSGVYDWSRFSAGASVQAADLVASGEADIAFNIAGGLHHAFPNRASGFCYINDAAVAIKHLVRLGKRVAYIDIDAHHGDGVEYAFYDSRSVLTISIHESGQWLFPGTGYVTDTGINDARGYAVNVPLPPSAGDEVFLKAFEAIVPPFIESFAPDIMVTQLGVDTLETDPITHLGLTTNGFEAAVRRFKSFGIPWVALGGGGYDLSNVARSWTLAWAVMNGIEPPREIPGEFIEKNGEIFKSKLLRDEPLPSFKLREEEAEEIDKDLGYLLKEVLPGIRRK